MNNIFEFAPKELVQDAFICWCFNFANSDKKEEVEFARSLTQRVYEITGGERKLNIKK